MRRQLWQPLSIVMAVLLCTAGFVLFAAIVLATISFAMSPNLFGNK